MKTKIICRLLVCLFLPTGVCGLLTEKRTGDSFLIPIDSLSLAGASIEGQVIWPDGDAPSISVWASAAFQKRMILIFHDQACMDVYRAAAGQK